MAKKKPTKAQKKELIKALEDLRRKLVLKSRRRFRYVI
jgi:hypothetical protein